jgi:hypothetical protein
MAPDGRIERPVREWSRRLLKKVDPRSVRTRNSQARREPRGDESRKRLPRR